MQVQEGIQQGKNTLYTRIAVIRLKGLADTSPEVERALEILRLRRRYACVIIDERPAYLGMLKTIKDWVTWGEVDADTLTELLRRRGRLVGDKPLTDDWIKKYGWSSIDEFALAYIMGEVNQLACPDNKPWPKADNKVLCIPKLKPFFRLHPPSGGLRGIKKSYNEGGDLGYRGIAINELILRML
ncbi:50S ribosomal protein L30 [Vulcanisaeta souniana]|uniref:Large ribosomal subunit protein uL30 n=1 Tax=Vulcanisaeta souniana JCM 11219 TaxID=1293586 RepID=A0A830EBK7_9CREN|nr:50S ribosomal protein L30 [Vulcanisaeta souniana]BDR92043.1 50S ribosomal protein L30 [Vulcanisaeta souniana JCM 11219]GGI68352.1 50S ribosomal protein L30 [Vulcanisaeta souniana JCM 11219]